MKTQLIEKLLEKVLESEVCDGPGEFPFEIGEAYLIRTVTYHVLGRVKAIKGNFLVLEEASWVADSGRFGNAIQKGELSEIEYVGKAIVGINAISDAYPWPHKMPKETK
jgi:hypothetical protein